MEARLIVRSKPDASSISELASDQVNEDLEIKAPELGSLF